MNYYIPAEESRFVEAHGGKDFLLALIHGAMAPTEPQPVMAVEPPPRRDPLTPPVSPSDWLGGRR